jgi:hypothetical protein
LKALQSGRPIDFVDERIEKSDWLAPGVERTFEVCILLQRRQALAVDMVMPFTGTPDAHP